MEASFAFVEDYTSGPDLIAYYKAAGYLPAPAEEASLRELANNLYSTSGSSRSPISPRILFRMARDSCVFNLIVQIPRCFLQVTQH